MAEVHPNDIGLATFEDVGDVQKLLTAAKNVVAAINEIYQNAGDKDNAFGVQLYVDGDNNVIIGQNNIVYGNNNLIVGSNNIIIGDNHTVFTNGTRIYSSPNLYPYSYDTETSALSYSVFEENFVPSVKVGDTVKLSVDAERREAIKRNHSSVHLLQAALRTVLGDHVEQAGSYVDEHRARFDFSHFQGMTAEEILKTEALVNSYILVAHLFYS